MSWKNLKCMPSTLVQDGSSHHINDLAKAARLVFKQLGIKPSDVGLTEYKEFGEAYNDENTWSRASRLWGHYAGPCNLVFCKIPPDISEYTYTKVYVYMYKGVPLCNMMSPVSTGLAELIGMGPVELIGVKKDCIVIKCKLRNYLKYTYTEENI